RFLIICDHFNQHSEDYEKNYNSFNCSLSASCSGFFQWYCYKYKPECGLGQVFCPICNNRYRWRVLQSCWINQIVRWLSFLN
ncbi:hypothetical protein KA005_58885, partial [bacterium]|nr:hypothetical protein [bacterium]